MNCLFVDICDRDLFWDNRFVCEVQIMCDTISHGIWVLKLSVRKYLVTDALFVWGWCVCVGCVCVCVVGDWAVCPSHFCKESQVESSCKFSWINENKSVLWITYMYKTSLEKLLGAQGGYSNFFFFFFLRMYNCKFWLPPDSKTTD